MTDKCSSCGEKLVEEEVESPGMDKDGAILCDKCFENKYTHRCPICEEFFDEEIETKITPKYLMVLPGVGEYIGLDCGIYEILNYPFFADGIIETHIFKDAVKRICDAPSNIEHCNTLCYICNDCAKKLEHESNEALKQSINADIESWKQSIKHSLRQISSLKFSHDYMKLPYNWEGTQAVLFGVQSIEDMKIFKNRYPQLIAQDTKFRNKEGNYELNFKEGILLIFYQLNSKIFFSTIRRFTPEKMKYYMRNQGEIFELIYTKGRA